MEAAVYGHLSAACFAASAVEQENALRALRDIEEGNAHNLLGLISVLATFVSGSSSPVREEIRLLAVICLKNVSLKSWNKIDESCKNAMWQFVHKALDEAETNSKVATQTAVLTAKMCRREWPSDLVTKQLFPYLFSLLRDRSNWRRQTQTIRTINEILQEVSSMRLPNSRSALVSLANDAFPSILMIWNELSAQLTEALPGMGALAVDSLHKRSWGALVAHLCSVMSAMRQLLVVGYESLAAKTDMGVFFGAFLNSLAVYARFCRDVLNRCEHDEDDDEGINGALYEDTEAFSMPLLDVAVAVRALLAEMSRLAPEVHSEFPLLVVPLLPALLSSACALLANTYSSGAPVVFSEPLVVSCITVVSNVLSCGSYSAEEVTSKPKAIARKLNSNSRTSPEEDSAASKQGHAIRQSFFDESRVDGLLGLLLQHVLYPSARELRGWAEDPEEYFGAQEGLSGEDSARAAGEGLFLALLDHSSEAVATHLVAVLRDSERQLKLPRLSGQAGAAETRLWSNVYLCCGLGVYKLGPRIDATDWFRRVVGPLVSALTAAAGASDEPQVLLFRLVWLCSCWAHAVDPALMPPVVDLFIAILAEDSSCDAAVLLQTIDTLGNLLANQTLSSALLLERFIRLVEVLCPLASSLNESEGKSKVIELLSALMAALGSHLRPLLVPLALHLQSLWIGSDPSSPVKLSLVQALVNVVRVARESSSDLHSLLVPVLAYSTSGADQSTFLAEEAVNLWLAVVRNATGYSQHLDELFRIGAPSLLAAELVQFTDPDKARVFMLVVESYVILGGINFIGSNAQALKLVLDRCLCRVPARVVSSVVRPIETMLIVCPADSALFLLQSGALVTLLRACAAAVPALAKAFEEHLEMDVALISYLSVVARLIVVAPAVLQQAAAALCPDDPRALLNGLMRLMVDKFDAVGYSSAGVWRQKLWCIALMAMYLYPEPLLLDWLPEVLAVCDTVAADQSPEKEHAELTQFHEGEESTADPLVLAFNRIVASDGVATVNVRLLVRERLDGLRLALGHVLFDQIICGVDSGVIGRLSIRVAPPLTDSPRRTR